MRRWWMCAWATNVSQCAREEALRPAWARRLERNSTPTTHAFSMRRASPLFTGSITGGWNMSSTDTGKGGVDRRSLLKGGAGAALLAGLGSATPAKAAGKKVVIGGFVDGALVPFKDKNIPLPQAQGFDIQFLQDEYGVTL